MLRAITFLILLSFLAVKSWHLAIAQEAITPPSTEANTDDNTLSQCHEIPLIFSKCIPSICVEESPFGPIYRQIASYDQTNNTCIFKERTPGFGGLNCSFKASNLDSVEQLYTKKSLARLDKNISLTEQESLSIQKLNKQNCTTLGEHEASLDPIPLNHLEVPPAETTKKEATTAKVELTPAPDEDITATIDDADEVVKTTPNTELKEETKEPFATNVGFKFKSLMFTSDELNLLNQALDAYQSGSKLSVGTVNEGGEIGSQIRSFFLKSLIYYNPDQWSLWIENSLKTEKITDSSNSSGLFIEEIKPEYATIVWQTPNLDKIAPDWKRFLISDSNNYYRNDKYDIIVKSDEQSIAEVTFRLRPNQTFNVNKMKITEGKTK